MEELMHKEDSINADVVILDDWIVIGDVLFRVVDTGRGSMFVMPIDHVILTLRENGDENGEVALLIVHAKTRLTVRNIA